MHYRWTQLRLVDLPGNDTSIEWWPVSLWRAALSAAEETLSGGPLAPAWLRLFRAHLSHSESQILRWRDDLAESAEMRRVYSGLYGRYFARTLLAGRLGITDFVPLNRHVTQISNGVTVERNDSGDIPDWIAWHPATKSYVLGEAKGCLTGNERHFLRSAPRCVNAGKAQFDRVVVSDSAGRPISTRNWVVANLWSTDERGRRPVSLLWDPPDDGATLSADEAPLHAAALRRHRLTAIARQLGDPQITVRLTIQPSDHETPSLITHTDTDHRIAKVEPSSREPHEEDYLAAVITPLGIQRIRNDADMRTARVLQRRAVATGDPALIYGLARLRRNPLPPNTNHGSPPTVSSRLTARASST